MASSEKDEPRTAHKVPAKYPPRITVQTPDLSCAAPHAAAPAAFCSDLVLEAPPRRLRSPARLRYRCGLLLSGWIDRKQRQEKGGAWLLLPAGGVSRRVNPPAMGLARRFLNLTVDNRIPGSKSLRCIDLRRHKLFNTTIPVLQLKGNKSESELPQAPLADNHKSKMRTSPLPAPSINLGASTMGYSTETCVLKPRETPLSSPESFVYHAKDRKKYKAAAASMIRKIRAIQLPQPIMNFECSFDGSDWYLDCLPLARRKVLFVDPSAHTVVFDVITRQLETIPCFNSPKCSPLPCWVPLPSSADGIDDSNGIFYILEGSPNHEKQGTRQQPTNQFEAFVYHSESKSWQRQLLPPPPFVCDPKHYEHCRPDITSYAVIERGGSHVIFVSVDCAGTYCLDTVTHTWSYVGDWVLPFKGKVEYVPELKLWFGICNEDLQLGAADLSTMDSQPQIVGTWKELETPRCWTELKPPQLVNLGSGRFCITRFFRALLNPLAFCVSPMAFCDSEYEDPVEAEYFTILTGIDFVPHVHDAHGTASDTFSGGNGSKGKVELQMIKHNSRRHMCDGSDGNIEVVF